MALSFGNGLLHELLRTTGPIIGSRSFFVQVGANDGLCLGKDGVTSACPLYPIVKTHRWPGLLIEPVEYLFNGLKCAYAGHDNLIFERVAVSDSSGTRPFFRIVEEARGLPWYAPKIGGLSDKVIRDELSHLPNLEELVVRELVECETLDSILERCRIEHVDLLQIDAEGEDFRILRSIDLRRYQPSVVMLEHKHLLAVERAEVETLLVQMGYELKFDENDVLATRRGLRCNAERTIAPISSP